MSAATTTIERVPESWRTAVSDVLVIAARNLRAYQRQPQLIIFIVIQPIMFILLFSYVFGGAIDIPGLSYTDFLVPGIIAQTVGFNSAGTAIAVAEDMSKGIVDRFRSLPMAHGAVIAGRVATSTVLTLITVVIMVLVGYLIGFRIRTGIVESVLALLFLMAFGIALAWISASIGLAVKDPEAAQSAGFLWLFPLNFVSSVFVPVETMPGLLQAFADVNPVTLTVNTLRGLLIGDEWAAMAGIDIARNATYAMAWFVGISAVFAAVSVRLWRRLA